MPGDRLVNGAGVSRETMGPVNGPRLKPRITDGRKKSSRQSFVGPFEHQKKSATAGSEYIASSRGTGPAEKQVTGSTPVRKNSGHPFVAATNKRLPPKGGGMTDCRIGVHALGAGGCGFESRRRKFDARRAVAQWQSAVTSLIQHLVGHFFSVRCDAQRHGQSDCRAAPAGIAVSFAEEGIPQVHPVDAG